MFLKMRKTKVMLIKLLLYFYKKLNETMLPYIVLHIKQDKNEKAYILKSKFTRLFLFNS